jgi:hypothetical protein
MTWKKKTAPDITLHVETVEHNRSYRGETMGNTVTPNFATVSYDVGCAEKVAFARTGEHTYNTLKSLESRRVLAERRNELVDCSPRQQHWTMRPLGLAITQPKHLGQVAKYQGLIWDVRTTGEYLSLEALHTTPNMKDQARNLVTGWFPLYINRVNWGACNGLLVIAELGNLAMRDCTRFNPMFAVDVPATLLRHIMSQFYKDMWSALQDYRAVSGSHLGVRGRDVIRRNPPRAMIDVNEISRDHWWDSVQDKSLQTFWDVYRTWIALFTEHPEIGDQINPMVDGILERFQRFTLHAVRWDINNLHDVILYLLVAPDAWNTWEEIRYGFFQEFFRREAHHVQFPGNDPTRLMEDAVVKAWWRATSQKITKIMVAFSMFLSIRNKETPRGVAEIMDRTWGKATPGQLAYMKSTTAQVFEIRDMAGFFRYMGWTAATSEDILIILDWAWVHRAQTTVHPKTSAPYTWEVANHVPSKEVWDIDEGTQTSSTTPVTRSCLDMTPEEFGENFCNPGKRGDRGRNHLFSGSRAWTYLKAFIRAGKFEHVQVMYDWGWQPGRRTRRLLQEFFLPKKWVSTKAGGQIKVTYVAEDPGTQWKINQWLTPVKQVGWRCRERRGEVYLDWEKEQFLEWAA